MLIKNKGTQAPVRQGEEFSKITSQGLTMVVDRFAEDISDLSQLNKIRLKEAEIMGLDPKDRNGAFASLSPVLANFSQNEANFKALEQIYTRDHVRFNGLDGIDDGGVAKTWFECYSSARAVRERKTSTVRLLSDNIKSRLAISPGTPIELVSIASGSARCIIETLEQKPKEVDVKTRVLDWDKEAIAYSRELAKASRVDGQIETIVGDVIRIEKCLAGRPIDIAEAVGIMDYFTDKISIFFLRQIHELLKPGGVVIVSNIMPIQEREFVHTAVGWRHMYYREAEEFARLFLEAGFKAERCKIHQIPLGDYYIIEAQKDSVQV